VTLPNTLLELLECPETHGPLLYPPEEDILFSPQARLKFPVRDEIPVLLISEAERLEEADAAELLKRIESAQR
jgi:uncharacterized protein YbaR (Trm112 family)